jgi:uncharacterized protein (TIGR02466 family)
MCKAKEVMAETIEQAKVEVAVHFPCPIYIVERPDFLDTVREVSAEYLTKAPQDVNEIYPALMSPSYANDSRLQAFTEFVGTTAWNILNEQGYAVQNFGMGFESMWTQEHHKQSSMEQHVHGAGAQIVGFYFLDVPENSSRVVFHDPRPGKVMSELPQQNVHLATPASQMINFEAKPGRLIFSNAWLPHSFTRHAGDTPLRFVHFNLVAMPMQQNHTCQAPAAEIV